MHSPLLQCQLCLEMFPMLCIFKSTDVFSVYVHLLWHRILIKTRQFLVVTVFSWEQNPWLFFLLHFFNRCTKVRRCALHTIKKTLIGMPSWNEGSCFNKQIFSISKQWFNSCFGSKFKCHQVLLSAFSSMSPPDTVLLKHFLEHLVQNSTNISNRDEITLSRISYSMRYKYWPVILTMLFYSLEKCLRHSWKDQRPQSNWWFVCFFFFNSLFICAKGTNC